MTEKILWAGAGWYAVRLEHKTVLYTRIGGMHLTTHEARMRARHQGMDAVQRIMDLTALPDTFQVELV